MCKLKRISAGFLSLRPAGLCSFGDSLPGCGRECPLPFSSAVADFWARSTSAVGRTPCTAPTLKRRDCTIDAIPLLFHLIKDAVYIKHRPGLYICLLRNVQYRWCVVLGQNR